MKFHRISVDMDAEDHRYLKMCCAKLGISIKEFVIKAVNDRVESQEEEPIERIPFEVSLDRKNHLGD